MLLKFLRSKVVLDAFTHEQLVLETAPIEKSVKYMPRWWKDLPNKSYLDGAFFPQSTAKKCPAILQYYIDSVTIPLWSDFALRVNQDKALQWQFSDSSFLAEYHSPDQTGGFYADSGLARIQLYSPWILKCNKPIKWMWSQPVYSYENPYNIVVYPGVTDFSITNAVNVQLGVNTEADFDVMIPLGRPLVHLTPMTEKEIVVKRHLISTEEWSSMNYSTRRIKFDNLYKTISNRRKEFSDCPFKGGDK